DPRDERAERQDAQEQSPVASERDVARPYAAGAGDLARDPEREPRSRGRGAGHPQHVEQREPAATVRPERTRREHTRDGADETSDREPDERDADRTMEYSRPATGAELRRAPVAVKPPMPGGGMSARVRARCGCS